MKIALIGATGFVGSAVLKEALAQGLEVTAIARHPEKITETSQALTIKAGDVQNTEEVKTLVAGHDAVVSAYNPGWANPNIYEDFLKGSDAILEGTKAAGVNRLLVVGGAGSLEIQPGVQLVDTDSFPAEWKPGALAARDFLNVIRKENELDWTFLSPAIHLAPGERTGVFRTGTDSPVFDEKGHCAISVEDLAVALVDEVRDPQFSRKRFTVGY
ncbi:MAG: NAD(P)-dependent oxidoreductase [Siphonobacter aquaeclarae]|nr:NAD(P)-dependent oxidoreductase [Siphonobacter aquaeclarae]